MSSMPARFVHRVKAAFVDTDMAGIVHFSNFFRYMEAAEDAFLEHLEIKLVGDVEGERLSFPRLSAHADYRSPLKYGEVLHIEVVILELGEKKIRYAFLMKCGEREVARGEILAICCAMTHPIRSVPIPASVREKLTGYQGEDPTGN